MEKGKTKYLFKGGKQKMEEKDFNLEEQILEPEILEDEKEAKEEQAEKQVASIEVGKQIKAKEKAIISLEKAQEGYYYYLAKKIAEGNYIVTKEGTIKGVEDLEELAKEFTIENLEEAREYIA